MVVSALLLTAGSAVGTDSDGTAVLGNGVTRFVGLGGQVGRDFCSEGATVIHRAEIGRRREWRTSGIQTHPNLGSSFGQSVCVDTCPSERWSRARVQTGANRTGGREASR
jgi:hypothetical protein